MTQVTNTWSLDLTSISENKEGTRLRTPQGAARELIGFDGAHEGGLRPYPGFHHVTDLELGSNGASASAAGTVWKGACMFSARVDDSRHVVGIIYRVVSGSTAYFRLKFRTAEGTYKVDNDYGFTNGIFTEAWASTDEPTFNVAILGKLVYILRAGKQPVLMYLTYDAAYDVHVLTDTGPGVKPLVFRSGAESVCVEKTGVIGTDMAGAFPVIVAPSTADAVMRFVYCGFSGRPGGVSLDAGVNWVQNPYLPSRQSFAPVLGQSTQLTSVLGPSELRRADDVLLWASPPFPDPTFADDASLGGGGTQLYTTPATYGEHNGGLYRKEERDTENEEPAGLEASTSHVWAYQLLDTRTGRMSQLSERVTLSAGIYGTAAYVVTSTVVSGTVLYTAAQYTFPAAYIVYDKTRWDKVILYRGRTVQGLTVDQVQLNADGVYTLLDYHTDPQPVNTDFGSAVIFCQSDDDTILLGVTYVGGDVYYEEMPTAGCGIITEGVLICGDFRTISDTAIEEDDVSVASGLSMVRWSTPFRVAPELFRPTDKYYLPRAHEEVIAFATVGPNVVGISRQGAYLFRRETVRMQGYPILGAVGITGPKAYCEMASSIFYCTELGVKTISGNGQLEGLQAINHLIVHEWSGYLSNIRMGYDAVQGVIWIFNPDLKRAVLLWSETSMITELRDMTFVDMLPGDWPRRGDLAPSATNPVKGRTLFVMEVPFNEATDVKWRLYAPDTTAVDTGRNEFIEHTGPSIFAIDEYDGSGTLNLGTVLTDAMRLEGLAIYVLTGENAGNRGVISCLDGASGVTAEVVMAEDELGTWDTPVYVGISPIYGKFLSAPLVGPERGGRHSRVRNVESVQATFWDVDGTAAGDSIHVARFKASVYKANREDPMISGFPTTKSDDPCNSVVDGTTPKPVDLRGQQGGLLMVGIEVFCPNLDYTLVEVLVNGKVEAASREGLPT